LRLRLAKRAARVLWALPNTAIGLGFALVARATGGHLRRVAGAIEAHGGVLPRLLAVLPIGARSGTAVTLGHVVLGSCARTLAVTRAHERAHVEQYERWGPLFLPAYTAASLRALARGRDAYLDNRFEREARRRAGR
jgi:hypothetical protein